MSSLYPIVPSEYAPGQRQVVRRCAEMLTRAVDASNVRAQAVRRAPLSLHPQENLIGIIGPRGSGKSTVIAALPAAIQSIDDNRRNLCVLPVIDCSGVPVEVPPGLVVIERMRELVENLHGEDDQAEAKRKKLIERLRRIAQTQVGMSQHFHTLNVELSSSPEDYSEYVVTGVHQRLKLREELRDALEDLYDLNGTRAVVAILEDFDLIPGDHVRRWFQAFLDEFQQTRLYLVATADLHRLEYLSLDRERQFDEQTGRAIVAKILPPHRRIRMPELSLGDQLGFRPFERRSDPPAPETASRPYSGSLCSVRPVPSTTSPPSPIHRSARAPRDDDGPTDGRTLGALIEAWFEDTSKFRGRDVLLSLLPTHPRGLRALWHTLETRLDERDPQVDPIEEGRRREMFLSMLATARGEALLARRLDEEPVLHILRAIELEGSTAPERWGETWIAAQLRDHDRCAPLGALRLREVKRGAGQRADGEAVELRHDPQWENPIRKDHLRLAPLRDSPEFAHPYWLEALADEAMRRSSDATRDARARYTANVHVPDFRTELVERWEALRTRVQSACFRVAFHPSALQLELHEMGDSFRQLVHWIHWERGAAPDERKDTSREVDKRESSEPKDAPESPIVLEIGWYPLYRVIRGERSFWPTALLSEMGLNLRMRPDARLEVPSTEFLPDRMRSLVLFVDALERCPWAAFSRLENRWPLWLWIRLAAAFVRAAYTDALSVAHPVDGLGLNHTRQAILTLPEDGSHKTFLDQLHRSDPILGLASDNRWGDTRRVELEKVLSDFEATEFTALSNTHPLQAAAQAYLSSKVYSNGIAAPELTRRPKEQAG